MVIMTNEGIICYVLPECARCRLTGKNLFDMDNCPRGQDNFPFGENVCITDCFYYEEEK